MSERFGDFDAFVAEQEQVGPRIKLGGKVWTLPPDLPASVALRVLRAMAQAKCQLHPETPKEGCPGCADAAAADFTNAEVADFVEQVLGAQAPEMLPLIGMSNLGSFLMMVVSLYTGENGGPNRETRRALGERGGMYNRPSTTSRTGPASSPTSSESTESTPPQPFEQASAGDASGFSSPT